jgi:hypothetical protein
VIFPPRFSWKVLQLPRQRLVVLRVDSLSLWKKSNEGKSSWSQKLEARNFPANFCARNFWVAVCCFAATSLTVALSPGRSDITRFRLWSPIVTGYRLDRTRKTKNFQKLLRRLAPLTFMMHVGHFGTHFAVNFRMSKYSCMMDSTCSREKTSYSAIDCAKIW